MARPGVEYDDVARVAQLLITQGEFPSVQKVRTRLGTGSNTTINAHLKVWQASFATSKKSPVLPESVPEDLMNPLDEFWSLALAKAEANYQKYREELDANVVAAESAKQQALTQLAEKVREMETLQQSLITLETKFQEAEQYWHILQGEHTVTANELVHAHLALERVHTLLQKQKQDFDTEHAQLSQKQSEAIQYERVRATTTENRLSQEIDRLRQTIKLLETNHGQLKKECQDLKVHGQHRELSFQQEITHLTTLNQQLKTEYQQRQHDIDEIKLQLNTAQGQLSKSLGTVESLREALEQSKEKELNLTERIGQLTTTITQLEFVKRG